ncbi:hypothetical protein YC2023_081671 [Brassica napus]
MRSNSASHNSTDADALIVQQRRKIASTIVTPSRVLVPLTENITYRSQELALELSFSPNTSVVNEDAMVIEALSDMDITGGQEDGRLESAVQDEDLLGLDLMEYEAVKNQTQVGVSSHGKQKKKDEYGIYRDDQGYARDLDGHANRVHSKDIRRLLERASRDEPNYICLPEHASSFTQTKLYQISTPRTRSMRCSMESVENKRRTKKPSR